MTYDIIDIGSKHGGAIEVARTRLAQSGFEATFFGMRNVPRNRCLAIDRNDHNLSILKENGFATEKHDVNLTFPKHKTKLFLAFHMLEHLQSHEQAQEVLRQMFLQSTHGVWLRLPSFEQNKTGSGTLRSLGLCWNYETWKVHSCHFKLRHAKQALDNVDKPFSVKVKPSRFVPDTSHPSIIPVPKSKEAQGDGLGKYSESMGEKPFVKFSEPLVAEWEVFIRWVTKSCKGCSRKKG